MIIYDQFGTIQNLQRALIPKNSNWLGTIFGRFLQQTGFREWVVFKNSFLSFCPNYDLLKGDLLWIFFEHIPSYSKICICLHLQYKGKR